MVTVEQIINILKQGTFVGNLTQIRAGDRNFHLYPSIEVTRPQPLSPTTDPELITSEEVFEVQIFVRYTRKIIDEDNDLNTNELQVLSLLGAQPLQEGQFQFQSETWNRQQTKKVQGVVSTLRVLFRQIVSAVDGGVIGGGSKLQLGSTVTLDLIGTATAEDGINHSELWNDAGKRSPIPDGNVGVRFFEYAWTMEDYNAVQALLDAKVYIPAKIVESNGDERNFTVLLVRQREQKTFAGLKTVTIQAEVVG